MSKIDPDDSEWQPTMLRIREAIEKSRGYASYWEWGVERRRVEMRAAEVLRNYLLQSREWDSGELSYVENDPPDILLTTEQGILVGIEVTELVDSDFVERSRYRKNAGQKIIYDVADWSPERIAKELTRMVEVKDKKMTKTKGEYSDYFLAVVTDEPMIDEAMAREAIAICRPESILISRAFLILSYGPKTDRAIYPDGCLVFQFL